MKKKCSVPDCDKEMYGKGVCHMHYCRLRRTGSLEGRKRAKPACSIEGCEKPSKTKGLCNAHYKRLWFYGDPLAGGTATGEPLRFIQDVVLPHQGSECLIWPYAKDRHGYGRLRVGGSYHGAHRYVCKLVNGKPPTPKHDAAHSCGNGHLACVNPFHLSWKTRRGNMYDRVLHGTQAYGENHSSAKLTEQNVREILRLRGIKTQRELADQFGVGASTICGIQRRRSWANLEI